MRNQDLAALTIADFRQFANQFAKAGNRHVQRLCRLIALPALRPVSSNFNVGERVRDVNMWAPHRLDVPETPPPADGTGPFDCIMTQEALKRCPKFDQVGTIAFTNKENAVPKFVFIAAGSGDEDAAIEFMELAEAAGMVTQTMDPSTTEIHSAVTSLNLWFAWLFGYLRRTAWVEVTDRYEAIENPFGASCELSRIFAYQLAQKGSFSPAPAASPKSSEGDVTASETTRWNPNEERDKWIYEECIKGTPYKKILAELSRLSKETNWETFDSITRVWQIGREYAEAHGLKPPQRRKN